MLIFAGLTLALPGGELVGFTNTELNLGSLAVGLPALIITWLINRGRPAEQRPTAA